MVKGVSHTQMYLLPLCRVEPSLYKEALYNSFYKDNKKYTYEIHCYLYKNKLTDKNYDKLLKEPNYLSDYDLDDYIVFVFYPDNKYLNDVKLLLQSNYTEISNESVMEIIKFNIKPFIKDIYYKEVNGNIVECSLEEFMKAKLNKINTIEKKEYTHELCSLCADAWEERKKYIAYELDVDINIVPFPISIFQDKFNKLNHNEFVLWGQKEPIMY